MSKAKYPIELQIGPNEDEPFSFDGSLRFRGQRFYTTEQLDDMFEYGKIPKRSRVTIWYEPPSRRRNDELRGGTRDHQRGNLTSYRLSCAYAHARSCDFGNRSFLYRWAVGLRRGSNSKERER